MVGGGYKRLAQISADKPTKACDQALKKIETAYRHAWQLYKNDPYPLTNVLVARILRLLRNNDPEEVKESLPELVELKAEAVRLAEQGKLNSPDDFWASVGRTDANLIGYLLDCVQPDSTALTEALFDGLVKDYGATWRRYGSARELNSVIDHYAFLNTVLRGVETHKNLSGFLGKTLLSLISMTES